MPTAADAIAETKRYIYSGAREEMNQLSTAYTAAGTSLSFTHALGGIKAGAFLGIDLEVFYVFSVTGTTATVVGAQLGSVAANHSAAAVVTVNPRFSDFTIFETLNYELADLSSPANGLYRVSTIDLTYSAAAAGYDMTAATDVIDILGVTYELPDSAKSNPAIPPTSYRLERNMQTADFASGMALIIKEGGYPGQSIRVRYKAPFTSYANAASTLASTGLPSSAADIPPLGAAARLVPFGEVKRNFTEAQGDTRRAQEVPPGARSGSGNALLRLRDRRIANEAGKLRQAYPYRRY